MSRSDYYICPVCEQKALYDADEYGVGKADVEVLHRECLGKYRSEIEQQREDLDRLRRYLSHDIHWRMLTTSAHLWGWGALYPHEKAPVGTPCYISPKDCDRIVDAAVGRLRELIAQRLEPEATEPGGAASVATADTKTGDDHG